MADNYVSEIAIGDGSTPAPIRDEDALHDDDFSDKVYPKEDVYSKHDFVVIEQTVSSVLPNASKAVFIPAARLLDDYGISDMDAYECIAFSYTSSVYDQHAARYYNPSHDYYYVTTDVGYRPLTEPNVCKASNGDLVLLVYNQNVHESADIKVRMVFMKIA